ncbi:MAG: hypothetical protein QG637_292 [Chloroflexota bacterium]|nr:hypothetical protein [Chloroflexota bacterium]
MSGQAIGIDHVGVVGPSLDELASAFVAIGFNVTPRATHAGGRTGNHCVMLEDSYLELVATTPGGVSATLAQFLARHAGLHILAFRTENPRAAAERLAIAGWPGLSVSTSTRALNDQEGPEVGFTLVTPPDLPEGRVHLIRHRDSDMMWQPRFLSHPNRATHLAEVIFTSDNPASSAARYSTVAGAAVRPDPLDGYALGAGGQQLRFLSRGAIHTLLPARTDIPRSPCIVAVTLYTSDNNAALRAWLARQGLVHEIRNGVVVLTCLGVVLRFVPSPVRSGD